MLCGCGLSRQEKTWVRQLCSGERTLYAKDKADRTHWEKEWSGDSAMQGLAPYPLLELGPDVLNDRLELGMDPDALKDVALAWQDFKANDWREKQGYQVNQSWKGEHPFAPGAAVVTVSMLPFVRSADLVSTDSAYLDQNRLTDLPSGYEVRAVRIVRHRPLCLLAVRSDLCHAGESYEVHDYLYYHPNGLIRAVVHLERPCNDGVSFDYLRYGWSRDMKLSRLEYWSADESEETMEVHAGFAQYDW